MFAVTGLVTGMLWLPQVEWIVLTDKCFRMTGSMLMCVFLFRFDFLAAHTTLEKIWEYREASCCKGGDEQVLPSHTKDVAGLGKG